MVGHSLETPALDQVNSRSSDQASILVEDEEQRTRNIWDFILSEAAAAMYIK
jgi:hypothetical protein